MTLSKLFLLPLLAVSVFGGPVTYNFSVDTSTAAGTAGFVEFQFNPGLAGISDPATVEILGFTTDGTLGGSPMVEGDVTGVLPGTLTLNNTAFFNDYLEGLTFGTTIQFQLKFSGPAFDAPTGFAFGSSFAFAAFDDQFTPLFTADPNGFLVIGEVDTTGGLTVNSYGGQLAQVPEPATYLLSAVGFAALVALRRR